MKIRSQGLVGRAADYLMMPVMYLLQGNFREVPQRTHRWNNIHLQYVNIADLHADKVVIVPGVPYAQRRWFGPIPLFHMPIFGGWKKFIVLEPVNQTDEWYIGWVAFDALGLSKIPLSDAARLGIGPRQAQFYGLDSQGNQLDLRLVGEGYIGKAGHFSQVPLL